MKRWTVEFQRPNDGGDDGLWVFEAPYSLAPSEAEAHAMAWDLFREATAPPAATWDGIEIRETRLEG